MNGPRQPSSEQNGSVPNSSGEAGRVLTLGTRQDERQDSERESRLRQYLKRLLDEMVDPAGVLAAPVEPHPETFSAIIDAAEVDAQKEQYVVSVNGKNPIVIPVEYTAFFGCFARRVLAGVPSGIASWQELSAALHGTSDPESIKVAPNDVRKAVDQIRDLFEALHDQPLSRMFWIQTIRRRGCRLNVDEERVATLGRREDDGSADAG